MSAQQRPSQVVRAAAELKALLRLAPAAVPLALPRRARRPMVAAIAETRRQRSLELSRRISRRTGILALEIAAGVLFVTLALMAALHARLTQGPIDVGYLVAPIEQAINSQFQGLQVRIGGAVLRYEDGSGGARFRLRDIEVLDDAGARVAEAPFAGISLSGDALLSGQVAPAGISLIEPRVLVSYSATDGLALSIAAAPEEGSDVAPASQSSEPGEIPATPTAVAVADGPMRVVVAETLAKALQTTRLARGASYYLTRIGLERATLVLQYGGEESSWQLPEFSIRMEQKRRRSVIAGSGVIESERGPWKFSFSTEDSEQKQQVSVVAAFENVVLKDLAQRLPGLELLAGFDVRTNGELRIDMARNGDVAVVEASAQLGSGSIDLAGDVISGVAIEDGLLQARYSRQENKLELLPSVIRTATSRASIVGVGRPRGIGAGAGWDYSVRFLDVALGDTDFGLKPLPIDSWTAKGSYETATGLVVIEQMRLEAEDARVSLTGQMSEGTGLSLEVTGENLPTGLFQRLWPVPLGSYARDWSLENLKNGTVDSASLKVAFSPADLVTIGRGGAIPDGALKARLVGRDVMLRYAPKLPTLQLDDVTAEIVGQRMTISANKAAVRLPSGRQMPVSAGSFRIDDLASELPQALVHFEVASDIDTVTEYLKLDGMGLGGTSGALSADVDGDARGTFDIAMPLLHSVSWRDMTVRGKTRLTGLSSPAPFGSFQLQGGTIDVSVSEKAIEGRGDLLLNGVSAELKWQRLFGGSDADQPPLRLSAKLDDADRDQLGIAVNHFVSGDVPVTVIIEPVAGGEPAISVTADMTAAELILENMAWRKPPGQSAVVQFDVVRRADGGYTLADLKVAGDDIAISGEAVVGPDNRLRAFDFPSFSFNVITQMQIAGTLGADNIWSVKARGTTFDGRQFFRSLFSAGKLTDSDLPPPRVETGIDLTAEIGTMIGYSETAVREVNLVMKRRNGRLAALDGRGVLDGGKPIAVSLSQKPGEPRYLLAEAADAGRAFKLVGFYSSVVGGQASLKVDLDGSNGLEKTGTLWARDFSILGNKVTNQVLEAKARSGAQGQGAKKSGDLYSVMSFKRMRVPFSVGYGQLAIYDSYINGDAIGATLRGRIDFNRQQVQLGGTYVPLFGLNSAIGGFPVLGDILVGRTGEGILGITFAIHGPLTEPQVTVNPMSAVAPGVFRQMFDFYQSPPGLTPGKPGKSGAASSSAAIEAEASSSEPQIGDDLGPSVLQAPVEVAPEEAVETVAIPLPGRNPSRDLPRTGKTREWQAEAGSGSGDDAPAADVPEKPKKRKAKAPAVEAETSGWSTSSAPE